MRQALCDGGLLLDVGAYTILAAECDAEVIVLEPTADTFGLLLENIALNDYKEPAGPYCGTPGSPQVWTRLVALIQTAQSRPGWSRSTR